uniref:GDNF/GAS1 domain-containing protein n=1 Tax=Periophthalmus magnuspinnatus TaxID=409849 RepID=A0A3B4BHI3_9GOBI
MSVLFVDTINEKVQTNATRKMSYRWYENTCLLLADRLWGNPWAVCNLSLPSVLELYPTLKACVCEQEAALCASIPALLTQCHQKTVDDTSGSCLERIRRCLSDAVCNGRMAPVLQDCMEPNCDPDRCQTATTAFFRAMPPSVGRMLVMCQCQDSDEACGRMSSALHSGSCGTERTNCLHIVTQCIRDRGCRYEASKCKTPGRETILVSEPECQTAFLDTVGTALHYPCSCEGLLGPDLQTCGRIHEVFHNRSLFSNKILTFDTMKKMIMIALPVL